MTSTDFHVEAIDRLVGTWEYYNEEWAPYFSCIEGSNICHRCWAQSCPLCSGVRYAVVSAIQWCPLFIGVRYSEVSAIQRFSYKVLH